jgi:hypothetical protein
MSVQKNGAQQEIKAADEDAHSTTGNMNIVIGTIRVQAIGNTLFIITNEILCFH